MSSDYNWSNDDEEGNWDLADTPLSIESLISLDIKEIDILTTLFCKNQVFDDHQTKLLLYFSNTILLENGLNHETLNAWGLSETMCFCIRLNIFDDNIDEIDVEVGQISYEELDKKNIKDVIISKTIVSWVVRDLVKKLLRHNEVLSRDYNVNDLVELVETFNITPDKAILLLQKNKKNAIVTTLYSGVKIIGTEENSIKEIQKYNQLVDILSNVKNRIINASSLCLICSGKIKNSGIKPIICSAKICQVKYYEFGIGYSLDAEISMNPETLDLQITLAFAAFVSNSKTLEFIELREGVTKQTMIDCMSVCPSIDEMKQIITTKSLHSGLDNLNPNLYGSLAWLMSTNSAHIRPLNQHERMKSFDSIQQFVLLCSTPEKEARFQELKRKEGGKSIWAFHGSSTSNWFVIMRTGLKILSNTKHMTSGAAVGVGIYMATNSLTSLGYSMKYPCKNHYSSMFGTNLIGLALCEIIPSKKKIKTHGDFIILSDEDRVVTRFLLIGKTIPSVSIKQIQNEIPEII
jgi:hypothetical protein